VNIHLVLASYNIAAAPTVAAAALFTMAGPVIQAVAAAGSTAVVLNVIASK
jgi:hypothetical protein